MLLIVLFAGILSAALNAGSTVLQRIASGSPQPSRLFSRKFAVEVTKNPLFLSGLFLQVLASAFHIVALSQGSLMIVQPLLSLNLVFLVIFLQLRFNLKTGLREWLSVVAITGGLCGLFITANPKNGHAPYHLSEWVIVTALITFVITVSIIITKHSDSPKVRAGAAGLASAFCYSLNASFAKLSLNFLKQGGLHSLFIHWPLYALITSTVTSIFLMQNAYAAGPLVISQPIMQSVDPILSSTIGIVIFGDIVHHSIADIIGGAISGLILLSGIISLGGSTKLFIRQRT